MESRLFRNAVIAILILGGAWWSLATAHAQDQQDAKQSRYQNSDILATPEWLKQHQDRVVLVDVRTDKEYDGTLIPGAIRMPWRLFRMDDKVRDLAEVFVGVYAAEAILGQHGITPESSVVIYDSAKHEGAPTAPYVFWVLDTLGHKNVRVLEGGIDAWKAAGGELVKAPTILPAVTYEATVGDAMRKRLIAGDFVYQRLDDPHYEIIDVRSPPEYQGEKGTTDMQGKALKLGHIPGAYNQEYSQAWVDTKEKMFKSAADLNVLYGGLDPNKTVIVYCNSGQRGAFSYYILRLLGHPSVLLYEPSWKEWGLPANHYPVELDGHAMPTNTNQNWGGPKPTKDQKLSSGKRMTADPKASQSTPTGGYVSCGG